MKRPKPWERGEDITAFFRDKSPEELDIIEHGGQAYYSERLRRKSPQKGQDEHVKLRVRAVGALDKARARLQALLWVHKLAVEEGYKVPEVLTIEQAEAIYGASYFDWLDTICIIAQVAVEHDQPGEPFYAHAEYLARNYTDASLSALWDSICFYTNHEDVRADELDEEQFIATVLAIDKTRGVLPLLGLAGGCRDRFVTSMASRLASYLTPKPSSPSTGRSTASPLPS